MCVFGKREITGKKIDQKFLSAIFTLLFWPRFLKIDFLSRTNIGTNTKTGLRAVVVAQLAARSFPTPEIIISNPVISKFYLTTVLKLY